MPAVLQTKSLPLKAKLLRGLADPSRLSILEALRGEPLNVSEIVGATRLSQPNTSNHLACLLECGLVSREQHGRQMIYRLGDGVDALLSMVDELLAGTAAGVEFCRRSEQPL